MVSKTGEAESITSHYLFALGSYRGLYILNWFYRYWTEGHYDLIAIVAGVVQTVLYCDFFYLYVTKGKKQIQNIVWFTNMKQSICLMRAALFYKEPENADKDFNVSPEKNAYLFQLQRKFCMKTELYL